MQPRAAGLLRLLARHAGKGNVASASADAVLPACCSSALGGTGGVHQPSQRAVLVVGGLYEWIDMRREKYKLRVKKEEDAAARRL